MLLSLVGVTANVRGDHHVGQVEGLTLHRRLRLHHLTAKAAQVPGGKDGIQRLFVHNAAPSSAAPEARIARAETALKDTAHLLVALSIWPHGNIYK
ncbi:hypothetical protein kuro4_09450 [Gelria sp. Kuro-4]|nr:hypothetical protein kuro4_09450 [Gelria sp. Kuro-4]